MRAQHVRHLPVVDSSRGAPAWSMQHGAGMPAATRALRGPARVSTFEITTATVPAELARPRPRR